MQNLSADPLIQVQPELRPHIHLVSSFKCESRGDPLNFSKDQIVDLLKTAAVETKSSNESWCWKVLETPRDRSAFIIWQSPQQLQGRIFPSDGYVWAGLEETNIEDAQGVNLETCTQYSGYVPSYEQYTLHARTRYRLLPKAAQHGQQNCDPCLWLVLYGKASKSRNMHVRNIPAPVLQNQKAALEQRRMILHYGTPRSKDFIWEDRNQWPEIKLPQGNANSRIAGANLIARSQQGPYFAGQQLIDPRHGQPTAKRLKQAAAPPPPYVFPEGEDDGGNGDVMDLMTPRDISRARYRQHAEWMEEIYASPFAIGQIKPISIGLGRTSQLAQLSKSLECIDTPDKVNGGEPARRITAAEFEEYIKNCDTTMAELRNNMEKEHALQLKRLARVRQGNVLQQAEKKLRSTPQFTSMNIAGKGPASDSGNADGLTAQSDTYKVLLRYNEEVKIASSEVEAYLDRRIEPLETSMLIKRGGLEDRPSTPMMHEQNDLMPIEESLQADGSSALAGNGSNTENPAGESTAFNTSNGDGESSRIDEDYVMVDKDREAQQPPQPEANLDPTNQTPDAGAGADEFLTFEAEDNEDNFDSMFTDTVGGGGDMTMSEEPTLENLQDASNAMENDQNTIDSLTNND